MPPRLVQGYVIASKAGRGKLRALQCSEWCQPAGLRIVDMARPRLGPRAVRIAVRHAGVNFADNLIIAGRYQHRPERPFTPGAEAAGEIIEVGEAVQRLRPGQMVATTNLIGAFAEELVAPEDVVVEMPDGLDTALAAAVPVTYGTVAHALRDRAHLRPGEVLVVHGAAGGIGLAAVELGHVMGARVLATVGDDAKAEVAREFGADATINYRAESIRDRVLELTDGRGADVFCDSVGGDAFDQSLRCIAWEGRLLVVGFTSGRIPEVPANRVLLKGCQIVGVNWPAFAERDPAGNRRNIRRALERCAAGEFRPRIAEIVPLEGVARALEAIRARKVAGKVIVALD